jgi:hypothetical protein
MTQIPVALFPPEYWQDFEELTGQICIVEWQDRAAKLNGRIGQAQAGIDVYGHDRSVGGYGLTGVQCKQKGQVDESGRMLAGGLLDKSTIEEAVQKAQKFRPALQHFIIATTALRDEGAQQILREIDQQHHQQGLFSVEGWFWNDYQARLNRYPELMKYYYENILSHSQHYSPDTHILDLLRLAFSRPAFNTSFHMENSAQDFFQALVDTQEAVETGRLKNREDRRYIFIAETGVDGLTRAEWRNAGKELKATLQKARDCFTDARQRNLIKQQYGFLAISDWSIAKALDDYRRKALQILNDILQDAHMPPIDSQLL